MKMFRSFMFLSAVIVAINFHGIEGECIFTCNISITQWVLPINVHLSQTTNAIYTFDRSFTVHVATKRK